MKNVKRSRLKNLEDRVNLLCRGNRISIPMLDGGITFVQRIPADYQQLIKMRMIDSFLCSNHRLYDYLFRVVNPCQYANKTRNNAVRRNRR